MKKSVKVFVAKVVDYSWCKLYIIVLFEIQIQHFLFEKKRGLKKIIIKLCSILKLELRVFGEPLNL
ncbi:hypothetical protein HanIR_Chr08g0347311 [Helianthus annuus]|nr:hypothetical protein HanIR_Chr08g0347311 [Helianthus annuus]